MSHTGQAEGGWEALDLDSSPMPRVSLSVLPLWLLGGNLLRTSAGGIRLLFVPSFLLLFPLFLVLGEGVTPGGRYADWGKGFQSLTGYSKRARCV